MIGAVSIKNIPLLAASLVLAASADASTITSSFSTPLAVASFQTTNNLDFFDSTLGTLTGAKFFFSIGNVFTVTGTNTSSQTQIASFSIGTQVRLDSALPALNSFLPIVDTTNFTTGSQTYAPGQTITLGPIGAAKGNTFDLSAALSSIEWNGTTGPGTFAVSCDAASGQSGSGSPFVIYSGTPQAQCAASIVYTYNAAVTSVPEPTSLALFSLALAGIG